MTQPEDFNFEEYLRSTNNPFVKLYLTYMVWDQIGEKFGRAKIVMDLYNITSSLHFYKILDEIKSSQDLIVTASIFSRLWWEIAPSTKAPNQEWQGKVDNINQTYSSFIRDALSKLGCMLHEMPNHNSICSLREILNKVKVQKIADSSRADYPMYFWSGVVELISLELENRNQLALTNEPIKTDSLDQSVGSIRDQKNKNTTPKESFLTLDKAFKSVSKYKSIMDLLASNEFIDSNTHIWKDEENSNKGTIISLLKILHQKGYFKRDLKHDEIINIALYTFGRTISKSLVKQHKLEPEIKGKGFFFIGINSTLN